MKKLLFLILIPLIFSCEKNLSGHWHLKNLEGKPSMLSIDILKNKDCYLYSSLSGKPIKGGYYPEKKQLFFPAQCGMFHFNYEYKNNKIYLKSYLSENFIAEKQDDECDRFNDFTTLLDIDYLIIKNQRLHYKPKGSIENEGLNQYINIDYSEKNKSIRIEFFNRINNVNKIDSIIKYLENSVSDSEIKFINYVLIPDKNLKASDLKLVIDTFNKGYLKRIFIQTLKIKPKKMNIFEYIKINKIELDSDNKLFYIIN
tara:strand:+ start:1130 stop:1900 length:771 start_codon:yes stop_codon:yes gene_type:complete